MEKKKWPWKRKPSERSPGESESSGSFSSHSERYSDEQDALRESPNRSTQSPEITSKASITIADEEAKESIKRLTEKLSAALVNVSAKEELVKQHAKVAEEAVAGWETAENEVATLKQQLEVAVEQNLNLEVRVSHLDGALKECVRELRQGKDEHEEKTREWESIKVELEKQILELQTEAEVRTTQNSLSIDPKSLLVLEGLEKENSSLKQELRSLYKELESAILERDLSTQAAETASKLQLESIKKVTKLEAECRRLKSVARKSSPVNLLKPSPTSNIYAESLTDSHSDSGERMNTMEIERNGSEPSCADSWASALIAELDQFKTEKHFPKSLAPLSVEIDMMDDFLEMERLAALPDTKSNTPFTTSETASGDCVSMETPLRAELDLMIQRVGELEKKLEEIEGEKNALEAALDESQRSCKEAQSRMVEGESKLDELQKELRDVIEAKELLESQLVGVEVESRTMSANLDSLKGEIEKERALSAELSVKCQELESELTRTVEQIAIQQNTSNSNGEPKIKQEDLAVAADKLVECQKTIESLGRQLKSLATLEDFLIDSSTIPGFSARLSSQDVFNDLEGSKAAAGDKGGNTESDESSPASASSTNHATGGKSRNGFGKFFTSKSKSVIQE